MNECRWLKRQLQATGGWWCFKVWDGGFNYGYLAVHRTDAHEYTQMIKVVISSEFRNSQYVGRWKGEHWGIYIPHNGK